MTHASKTTVSIPKIPGQLFLWLAILIFGASSSITRKITELGAAHFMGGQNPISLCNVLFIGNLCALIVLLLIHGRSINLETLRRLTNQEWLSLVLVAILSGALVPALVFQALSLTGVNNIVLVGRLEPPIAIALSICLLGERVNRWEVAGAIVALVGVTLTIVLQPEPMKMMMNAFSGGSGELLAATGAIASAIATIIRKKRLGKVPLGFFSIFRTALGTVIFFLVALKLYGSSHFSGAFSPFLWKWMLVYGSLIVVLGQSFWATGLRSSTVSSASVVSSFTPIVSILAAYFILGEAPTSAQYIGGSVLIFGLALSLVGTLRKMPRAIASSMANSSGMAQAVEPQIGFKGV